MSRFDVAAILGSVQMHYQPIVDLNDDSVIGYEALARFPALPDEPPESVFRAAGKLGIASELERECRSAAYAGAIRAGMAYPYLLFVNFESSLLHVPPRWPLDADDERAQWREVPVVLELTERGLSTDPIEVLHTVDWAREHGLRIALDDVGTNPESVALMPLIRPDVVKLDGTLIADDDAAQKVGRSVVEAARRIGATVVCEGIERREHLARARALGADLGQGYLLGRPAPLERVDAGSGDLAVPAHDETRRWDRSPWDMVAHLPVEEGTFAVMLAESSQIGTEAMTLPDKGVVFASFPSRRSFTPAIARDYKRLARKHSVVAALGVDGDGGADVRSGDRLGTTSSGAGQYAMTVIAGTYAIAVIGRFVDPSSSARAQQCRWVVTRDADLVADLARALFQHINRQPAVPGAAI